MTTNYKLLFLVHTHIVYFLPAGRVQREWRAGPKITLRFLHLFVSLCICTYHMRNNYIMYIVYYFAAGPKFTLHFSASVCILCVPTHIVAMQPQFS